MRTPGDPAHASIASVADVISAMEELSEELPAGDGVRAFNQMYLVTTQQVEQAIVGTRFSDPAFISRLDVVFAGLYLDALDRYATAPEQVPRCWRALFDVRNRPRIGQVQFAIGGMNAHINHDLSRALVLTAAEFGGRLDRDSPWRSDYLAINKVLARTQPMVKQELLTGAFAALDHDLGDEDDRVGMWGIERAREFAWSTAQAQWAVRGTFIERSLVDALDQMVELSSRLLLTPRP